MSKKIVVYQNNRRQNITFTQRKTKTTIYFLIINVRTTIGTNTYFKYIYTMKLNYKPSLQYIS